MVAVSSVCAVILLLYAQLGFYDTCYRSSTLLYDQMDFDLVLVSPHYEWLRFSGKIPLRYLQVAKQVPGVSAATPVYLTNADFQHGTDARHEVVILAAPPLSRAFKAEGLRQKLPNLKVFDSALVDSVMVGTNMPRIQADDHIQVLGQRIRVIDLYQHGAGFVADAVMIVSPETMASIYPGFSNREVSIGLIQLSNGVDVSNVTQQLERRFGGHVRVLSRPQVEHIDRYFFMQVKPNGIQFGAGVVLAVVVSAAVLYQLLATNVLRRAQEYSTLRAIGYARFHIYRFVWQESLAIGLVGFLPATAFAYLLYYVIRDQTNLPLFMTWQRIVLVVAVSLLICLVTGLAVTFRLMQRDPADLY